jgi:molybdate transport system substrate-binding protein
MFVTARKRGRQRCLGLMACAAVWLCLSAPQPSAADEALVAVAANFAEAAEALRTEFERGSGHRLVLTTGSTGKLYAQITQGAPFQVLLSADAKTPARLETEGLAVAGTRFTYAVGKLALWSTDPGRIGPDGRSALLDPKLRFVAIANPELAPYGVAAREALQAMGLWDAVQSRIVMGQNIGQVHSMVASGGAEIGFVALSSLLSTRVRVAGSRWDVPQELFTPIRQDAVLLIPGRDHPGAVAFLEHLRSSRSRSLIETFGYAVE